MKTLNILFMSILALAVTTGDGEARSSSHAGSHHVRSYTRKDGSTVRAHERTNPNHSASDNWSTRGNVNPITGKRGTVDPRRSRR